jgi:GSH-dependent disulfide-bond oxidoreductase
VASSPPLIGLFQVRVIKRNYRADGSHFSSTLRGRRTASRLRSDPSGGAVGCRVSEAVYDAWLIDIYKGDQFGSGFVDLNPNSKIPALIDYGVVKPVRIFEMGRHPALLGGKVRPLHSSCCCGAHGMHVLAFMVGWQRSISGCGFEHFYHYGPIKLEYTIDRFTMEAKRQLHVLDQRLA